MKSKILLVAALPVLLLSSCGGSSRSELTKAEWADYAQVLAARVESQVKTKQYPFVKYTMIGKSGNGSNEREVNSLYTFVGGDSDWYSEWNYEYRGTSFIPTQLPEYEMYTAIAYYHKVEKYTADSKNNFKWYKNGKNLEVEATYISDAGDKNRDTFKFNENGYALSLTRYIDELSNPDLSLTFSYMSQLQ